ncbi:initiation factor 2 [Artomyces pyxidatus]|uniref:Initiation factor 2 n=1 Tax=Artomyces pyxidatus TaxID=48021 RepID=A0ACB8TBF5_9AGAM|nr:initiation factor 2 [Artomyces pyxidatus]
MHSRSRRALSRLGRKTQARSVATATKPVPWPRDKWDSQPAASSSSLGKWTRPQDHNSPPPSSDTSAASPPSTDWSPLNLDKPPPANPNIGKWARSAASSSTASTPSANRWRGFGMKSVTGSSSSSGAWSDSAMPSGRRRSPAQVTAPTQLEREAAPHLLDPGQQTLRRPEGQNFRPSTFRRSEAQNFRRPLAHPQTFRPRENRQPEQESHDPLHDSQPNEVLPSSDEDQPTFESSFVSAPYEGRLDESVRRSKFAYKERRSLVDRRSDVGIPAHHRIQYNRGTQNPAINKKPKWRAEFRRPKIDVYIPSIVSVGTLARLLKVPLERLHRKMHEAGMGEDASYDHVLTSDYAVLLAEEFNRNPIINDEAAFDIFPSPPPAEKSSLPPRPPIVTIMGHVDHGKTTLLDTLRSSSVAKGEAGGITQHIGAFSVPVPNSAGGTITFLDTPGHAAFSAMRARGAGVTDIVVLVVAADDGVMPQTKEVIELVQKDKDVQLVVAINKVDKPGIDIEKVQNALLVEGVQLESLGGDIPSVEVSGLTGKGLDDLMETISAVAEVQDFRAERDGKVHGHVLESRQQKGLGPVATVLLLRGCLKPGSHVICGTTHAKVRGMSDSAGNAVKAAYPGMAVTVSGWKDLPSAGDEVLQGTEQEIKKAVANRLRKAEQDDTLVDIEAINIQRRTERERRELEAEAEAAGKVFVEESPQDDGSKVLKLIIKGDVSGSVEAVSSSVEGIGNDLARVKIVSTGVGEVSESDILRAKAAEGMVVAFSVPVSRAATLAAGTNNVPVYSSSIIYQVMDEVKKRVTDLLPAKFEKRVVAEAKVLQIFDIHVSGKQTKPVAGCRVTNGVLNKNKPMQVVRNGRVLHEGRLETMRHLKSDITEASNGVECGLSLESFSGLRPDDVIQMYQEVELPKHL